MTAGLTSAIMDTRTPQIVEAVKAADLLLGHDEWGGAWIAAHRAAAGCRHGRERPRDRRAPELLDSTTSRREGLLRAARRRARAATTAPAGSSSPSPSTPDATAPPTTQRGVRVPPGRDRLRLRVVERHRDRLHLRRPRHLPQVQGAGRGRRRRRSPGTTSRTFTPDQLDDGLAAGLPGPGDARPRGRRTAADHPAQGRHRRRRSPGDPAARRCRSGTSSSTSRPSPTSAPTWPGCSTRSTTSS